MAENKKGFVLYADQKELFDQLPNEKAGELIKHIFSYINDENPINEDALINMAFTSIKLQLKRDLVKYNKIRLNRSESGKKGMKSRWKEHNKAKQKITKDNSVIKPITNITDTVTVNVTVKDKVTVKDIIKTKPISFEVLKCYKKVLDYFPKHLHPKNKDKWLDTIEKLNRIDKIPFLKILEIVKKTRADNFWSKNFLSLTKLRKKNNDGIMYVVVFNERIKTVTKYDPAQELIDKLQKTL